jgi:hypothetical protein
MHYMQAMQAAGTGLEHWSAAGTPGSNQHDHQAGTLLAHVSLASSCSALSRNLQQQVSHMGGLSCMHCFATGGNTVTHCDACSRRPAETPANR